MVGYSISSSFLTVNNFSFLPGWRLLIQMANGQIVKSTMPLAATLNVQAGPLKDTGRVFVSESLSN
jgi:hypothetical protein